MGELRLAIDVCCRCVLTGERIGDGWPDLVHRCGCLSSPHRREMRRPPSARKRVQASGRRVMRGTSRLLFLGGRRHRISGGHGAGYCQAAFAAAGDLRNQLGFGAGATGGAAISPGLRAPEFRSGLARQRWGAASTWRRDTGRCRMRWPAGRCPLRTQNGKRAGTAGWCVRLKFVGLQPDEIAPSTLAVRPLTCRLPVSGLERVLGQT